jgi:N utilization substance protein B
MISTEERKTNASRPGVRVTTAGPGPRDLKAAMTRRTRSREIALQVLYQTEQNPGLAADEIRRFIERRLRGDRKLCDFAEALVAGVHENQPRIDALISQVAENWRLDRMAAIDRNILRLGAFEMLFCPDVPTKVAINESLELAKRYSTAQSSRFVNGILDRLQAVDEAVQGAEEKTPPSAAESPDEAGEATPEPPLPTAPSEDV